MKAGIGRVVEVRELGGGLDFQPRSMGFITCEQVLIPAPGQYVRVFPVEPALAWEAEPALASPLFPTESFKTGREIELRPGFWATANVDFPFPPGVRLNLLGPQGRGFQLALATRRLGVVALGQHVDRLTPLFAGILAVGGEVALFSDLPLPPGLPPAVEARPLEAMPEAFRWADEIVLDVPVGALGTLRETLMLAPGENLPCPAQAFIEIPMPCGGTAACGVCAIRTKRGWSQACDQGPVFDLTALF